MKKDIKRYKQNDLINLLSDKMGITKKDCKEFLDLLPECLMELFQTADKETTVEVWLTVGIILGARYIPERESVDPRDHKPIIVPAKLQPYGRFGKTFKDALNEYEIE